MTSFLYQSEMAASSYGVKDETGQKREAESSMSELVDDGIRSFGGKCEA